MKNICIKLYGLGIKDEFQAFIKILDSNHNIIYEGPTYNGEVSICINTNCIYRLYAVSLREIINIVFYVDSCRNKYYFYFPRSIMGRIITFLLKDSYYGIPIKKGELFLCQK